MEQEMHDRRGCDETVNTTQQDSNGRPNGLVEPEAIRVIPPEEMASVSGGGGDPDVNDHNELTQQSKVVGAQKIEFPDDVEKQSCVIDVKNGGGFGESKDGERICRICHLNSDQVDANAVSKELIVLGCNCKGELGVSHLHCAEAWFKLKGNRVCVTEHILIASVLSSPKFKVVHWHLTMGRRSGLCEICGETAKNIIGVRDNRFMEEWNERRDVDSDSSDSGEGCWRGQPFCNFLMACLVIAFVLPWFFRVNMF